MNKTYTINFENIKYPAREVYDKANNTFKIVSTLQLGTVSHGSKDPNITSIDWYVSEDDLNNLSDEEIIKQMQ